MMFFSASCRDLFLRALLVSIALSAAGCRSDSSRQALPFGVTDEPRSGEALRGNVELRGWALSEGGIKQVTVYVDRNYAATATLGISRPDVAKAYPAFAHGADAGWTASLDTGKFRAGTHELVVQGTANNGATRDFGDVNVSFVKP
jgi:N-acetylmuramoyl-L-alanine amidase